MNSTEIKAIGQLVRLLDSTGNLKRIFPEIESVTSKLGQFARGLAANQYRNSDEAAAMLYNSDQQSGSFRTLKYRLLTRALTYIQQTNADDFGLSKLASVQLESMRDMYVSQILLRKANRSIATSIVIRQIGKAREYDDTMSEIFFSLNLLTSLSRGLSGIQFRTLVSRLHTLLNRLVNEVNSEILLDQVQIVDYEQHSTERKSELLRQFSDTVRMYANETPSHTLILNSFRLSIAYALAVHDPALALDTSIQLQEYLSSNSKFSQNSRIGEIKLTKSLAHAQLRDLVAALDESNGIENCFQEYGYNWFLVLETRVVILLMKQQYDEFIYVLRLVFSSSVFSLHSSYLQERFLLLSAFSVLLVRLGMINVEHSLYPGQFRLTTLVNSVSTLHGDKDESNFQVIVLSLSLFALNGDYDSISDRMQSLRVYICRYLRSSYFHRDRLFIRSFTALSNCSFNVRMFRSKYQHLLDELGQPVAIGTPTSMNELIPYNVLLERLLAIIEERGY